jgi:hypothetical protein
MLPSGVLYDAQRFLQIFTVQVAGCHPRGVWLQSQWLRREQQRMPPLMNHATMLLCCTRRELGALAPSALLSVRVHCAESAMIWHGKWHMDRRCNLVRTGWVVRGCELGVTGV